MKVMLMSAVLLLCAGPTFAGTPESIQRGSTIRRSTNSLTSDLNDESGEKQWDEDVQRTFGTLRRLQREMVILTHENEGLKALLDGNPSRALADYDSLLALAPGRTDALVYRAGAKSAAGDLKGALADYAQALTQATTALDGQTDANSQRKARELIARIHGDRASTYMRIGVKGKEYAGNLDLALADCDEALRVGHPRPSLMTWQKSQILFSADRYEEAAKVYQQALSLDPKLHELGGHALFCRTFADQKISISACN